MQIWELMDAVAELLTFVLMLTSERKKEIEAKNREDPCQTDMK